jgi:hypothetical protein
MLHIYTEYYRPLRLLVLSDLICIDISDLLSFTTSTLMMETEQISETSIVSSTLTRSIARENFIPESFKSYTAVKIFTSSSETYEILFQNTAGTETAVPEVSFNTDLFICKVIFARFHVHSQTFRIGIMKEVWMSFSEEKWPTVRYLHGEDCWDSGLSGCDTV